MSTCLSVFFWHMCAATMETDEGIGSPTTAGTDGCGVPRGCWLLNLGLQQEQHVVLALGHFSSPLYLLSNLKREALSYQ